MRITEFEEKNRLLATQGFGAKYLLNGKWVETGALGNYNCISFNGNNVFKIDGDADFCNKVLNNTRLAA